MHGAIHSAECATAWSPSVSMSVTVYCMESAKYILKLLSLSGSPSTGVYLYEMFWRNSDGWRP